MIGLLGAHDVGLVQILMICVPSTLIAVFVAALVQLRIGKELKDDPEFINANREAIIGGLSAMATAAPWTFAFGLFFASVLLYSQAATVTKSNSGEDRGQVGRQSSNLTPLQHLLKWSVSDWRNRPVSLLSKLTPLQWIKNRLNERSGKGLRAAIQADPTNARLAAHFGRFLADYALNEKNDADQAGRARGTAEHSRGINSSKLTIFSARPTS
jgi:Anaerobic c4-dicarboxylate membrane transporter